VPFPGTMRLKPYQGRCVVKMFLQGTYP
jgi:hypothetical protein